MLGRELLAAHSAQAAKAMALNYKKMQKNIPGQMMAVATMVEQRRTSLVKLGFRRTSLQSSGFPCAMVPAPLATMVGPTQSMPSDHLNSMVGMAV
jgi:hypothetical protein